MKCPYLVLGIAHGADAKEARAAYVEKLKTAHPDRPGGSLEKAQALGEAHNAIKEGKASRRCDCRITDAPRRRAPEAADPFDFTASVDWEDIVRQAVRRAAAAAAAPRAYSSRDERTQHEDREAEARQAARHAARANARTAARAAAERFRAANARWDPAPEPDRASPRAGYHPPPPGFRPASAYQEPAPAPAYKAPPEPAKAPIVDPSPETADLFANARRRAPHGQTTSARERVEEFLRQGRK